MQTLKLLNLQIKKYFVHGFFIFNNNKLQFKTAAAKTKVLHLDCNLC